MVCRIEVVHKMFVTTYLAFARCKSCLSHQIGVLPSFHLVVLQTGLRAALLINFRVCQSDHDFHSEILHISFRFVVSPTGTLGTRAAI